MQRVDTHVHLWSAEELPLWLNDPALAPIACSRSVADFVAAAGPNLERAVYVEVDVAPAARQREAQTVTALCADGSNPLVGAVIGAPVVDGTVEQFASFVREWAANQWVKGVRQVLHIHPQGTCLRDDVVAKAQLCGELGLVFELCMKCEELADAATLASLAPSTRFVLDHCGGHHQLTPDATAAKREMWRAGIEACSKAPNIWCKISGLMGAQGGTDGASGVASWTPAAQHETCIFCLGTFREDRLIVGGDWPVCTLTAALLDWARCCEEMLASRPAEFRRKVLQANASEVYRL